MPYTADEAASTETPAAAFMTLLNSLLTVTGAFDFVEEYVATDDVSRVYKSPAADNVQGADWYLNVRRTADDATSVSFGIAEVWDAEAKLYHTYGPVTNYAWTPTPTAEFKYDDSGAGVAPNGYYSQPAVGLISTGYQYWVSVSADRLIVGTRVGTTDYGIYAGLYDDFLPIEVSPFPLCASDFSGYSGVSTSTREPNTLISRAGNFGLLSAAWTPSAPSDAYTSTPIVSKVAVANVTGVGTRGLFKDLVWCNSLTAANGDTLTVTTLGVGGTKTYTRVSAMAWVDQAI